MNKMVKNRIAREFLIPLLVLIVVLVFTYGYMTLYDYYYPPFSHFYYWETMRNVAIGTGIILFGLRVLFRSRVVYRPEVEVLFSLYSKFTGQLNYKIVLVLWLALGIGFSGYYFIHPPKGEFRGGYVKGLFNEKISSEKYYQDYALATIVGTILIGGIGFLNSKKKN